MLNLPSNHYFSLLNWEVCFVVQNKVRGLNKLLLLISLVKKLARQFKHEFRVISKLFIENIVPRAGHKDFLHRLQAIIMYALVTD